MPSSVLDYRVPHLAFFSKYTSSSTFPRVSSSTCFVYKLSLSFEKLLALSLKCIFLVSNIDSPTKQPLYTYQHNQQFAMMLEHARKTTSDSPPVPTSLLNPTLSLDLDILIALHKGTHATYNPLCLFLLLQVKLYPSQNDDKQ
ncbi:hypothetical protein CR513_62921, partial [Mucuna pruriens]